MPKKKGKSTKSKKIDKLAKKVEAINKKQKRKYARKVKPGLKITGGKGFHITFANKWTVSVQFGPHNYHSKRNLAMDYTPMEYLSLGHGLGILKSNAVTAAKGTPDAEVAVMKPNGDFFRLPGWEDDVKGWMKPEEVVALMAVIATIKK